MRTNGRSSAAASRDFVRPMGVLPPLPAPIEPRLQQILDESDAASRRVLDEHHASTRPLASPLTTDDSLTVARVVDMIEENPSAFALEYLNLTRFVKQLHRTVDELAERVNGLSAREAI
jgi:hypothetical protein